MIDYNKLKLVHELANKISSNDRLVYIMVGGESFDHPRYSIIIYIDEVDQNIKFDDGRQFCDDIDDLITKLTKLTQPQPKFKVGDMVWYLDFSKNISTSVIKKHDLFYHGWRYIIEECLSCPEANLYPTKQALIEAQIQHWQSMLERPEIQPAPCAGKIPIEKIQRAIDSLKKCEHESDGKVHRIDTRMFENEPCDFVILKCLKCGEFY